MYTSHFNKAGIVLMLLLAWSGMLFAQTNTPITTPVTKHINGYWEYLPAGYHSSAEKYPLIIFFHGIDEVGDGSQHALKKVPKNAIPKLIKEKKFPETITVGGKKFSFIVICPQLTVIGRSAVEIDELIDYMVRKYRVDESRIYLTGISLGGGTCMYYAGSSRTYAGRVAAMVTASQNQNVTGNGGQNVASTNLPLWMTHNRYDRKISVKYTLGWYDYLTSYKPAMDPQPIMNIFEQSGHDAWSTTFNPDWRPNGLNVYEWMLQYTRGGERPPPSDVKVHPVIKAPDTVILNRKDPILLDGSGSYSDDQSRLFYKWEYVSGPGGFNITNPNDDKTYFYVRQAGQYVVKLTVYNNRGISASLTKTLTVIERVQPVAIIKNDPVIELPDNSIVLDASSSYDRFGKIVAFNWQYISGPQGFSASNRKQSSLTLEKLSAGTYQFAVVVTNDAGLKDTAITSFRVVNTPPTRTPPVAVVKNDAVVVLPKDSILLDASASHDKTGKINLFQWWYVSGPSGFILTNNKAPSVMVKELVPGSYRFGVAVTNDAGLKDTAIASFIVRSAPPVKKPPVAVVKNDAVIVLPKDSILLDASSSYDSAGKISSYEWRYVSGPWGFTMSNNKQSSVMISHLSAGSYRFGVIVANDVGLKDTAITSFIVKPAPEIRKPPVAIIKNEGVIVLPQDSIKLDASASYDSSGKISTYEWKYISGPSGYTMSNNKLPSLMIDNLVAGSYKFSVIVTNNLGLKDTAVSGFVVKEAPQETTPPIAVVTNDLIVLLPKDSTILDASASYDKAGRISSFEWRYISGPTGFTIVNDRLPVIEIKNLTEGFYRFGVIITNGAGLKDTGFARFSVKNPQQEKTPPVAVINNEALVILPKNYITLDASSSYDSTGTIKSYEWRYVFGPKGFTVSDSSQPTLSIDGLSVGSYRFGVIVTDNTGLKDTAITNFVVKNGPKRPTPPVAIIKNESVIVLPKDSIVLDAGFSYDSSGSIAGYDWRYVFGPQGFTASVDRQTLTLKKLSVGSYRFGVIVRNSIGLKDTAITNFVVKNEGANILPVAIIRAPSVITLPQQTVTLDGSASFDEDGKIESYLWQYVSGPARFNADDNSSPAWSLSNLSEGLYVFRLTVKDDQGGVATATDTLQVSAAPVANRGPVAVIKAASEVMLPDNSINLDGTSSYDPDGHIKSYVWRFVSGPPEFKMQGTTQAEISISDLVDGEYSFMLIVTDDKNNTDSALFSFVVKPALGNASPFAIVKAPSVITLPDNSIELDGSASYDPDGSIHTYQWLYISGPSGYSAKGLDKPELTINNLTEGNYKFRFSVTDNAGSIADTVVNFIVKQQTVNIAPIAIIEGDSVYTLPLSVIGLNGGASYDPDGTIRAYSWRLLNAPSGVALYNSSSSEIHVSGLAAGSYKLELRVTDNKGQSATSTFSFKVKDRMSHTEVPDMFVLAPVPAISTLNVRLSNDEKGKLTVRVTDFNGKIVFLKNYDKQTVNWQQTIDVANYASGVYFVDVYIGKISLTRRFIKGGK
ncbi:T9SS type A sorting domain-containing protein [Danxiaibacter flavus]|uniref:T9SS type A sorting domain-containing protein n=1 Tax=Danxiaibacter flavus TaxID=3049108 RepID=A0ABV3ZJP3_9BACT|nr:T9SS type A sorting domain-containing protein [Chitinophagaceae bacterium DXS]